LYVWHDATIRVSWLIHTGDMTYSYHGCDMTQWYVWHDSFNATYDSFICVSWLILVCDMTDPYMWHDSSASVSWLIHTCYMSHAYVWCDALICVTYWFVWHDWSIRMTWLVHTCGMVREYVHVCKAWLIYVGRDLFMCDMTHSCAGHDWFMGRDSFIRVIWLVNTCDASCRTGLIQDSRFHMCDMTLSHVWHDSCTCMTLLMYMCDTAHSYVRRERPMASRISMLFTTSPLLTLRYAQCVNVCLFVNTEVRTICQCKSLLLNIGMSTLFTTSPLSTLRYAQYVNVYLFWCTSGFRHYSRHESRIHDMSSVERYTSKEIYIERDIHRKRYTSKEIYMSVEFTTWGVSKDIHRKRYTSKEIYIKRDTHQKRSTSKEINIKRDRLHQKS